MLDLKFIRENADAVRQNISNKNESANIDFIIQNDSPSILIAGNAKRTATAASVKPARPRFRNDMKFCR